jgi:hypothetical protein
MSVAVASTNDYYNLCMSIVSCDNQSSIGAGMKPALGTGCVEIFKHWCLSSLMKWETRKVLSGCLTLNFTFLMSFLQRNKRVPVALRLLNSYQVGT